MQIFLHRNHSTYSSILELTFHPSLIARNQPLTYPQVNDRLAAVNALDPLLWIVPDKARCL